jgi:hypothetical protein
MISPNLTRMAAEKELQKICTFVKVPHAVPQIAVQQASRPDTLQRTQADPGMSLTHGLSCTVAEGAVTQHTRHAAGRHRPDAAMGERRVHQDAAVPGEYLLPPAS